MWHALFPDAMQFWVPGVQHTWPTYAVHSWLIIAVEALLSMGSSEPATIITIPNIIMEKAACPTSFFTHALIFSSLSTTEAI